MNKFRFAIMGAGGIAGRFCHAVSEMDNCVVVAVASKSHERAKDFAEKNGVPSAYRKRIIYNINKYAIGYKNWTIWNEFLCFHRR